MYNLLLDDFRHPHTSRVRIPQEGMLLDLTNTRRIDWTIARSHAEFVKIITEKGIPKMVSFDHDLCEDHMVYYHAVTRHTGKIDYSKLTVPTGRESARFFVRELEKSRPNFEPKVFIHSANAAGRYHIAKALGLR